jgi:hypothetical protein
LLIYFNFSIILFFAELFYILGNQVHLLEALEAEMAHRVGRPFVQVGHFGFATVGEILFKSCLFYEILIFNKIFMTTLFFRAKPEIW